MKRRRPLWHAPLLAAIDAVIYLHSYLPIIRSPLRHYQLQALIFCLGVILGMGLVFLSVQWPGIVPSFIPFMMMCVTPLTFLLWWIVPARCPQCQGKSYFVTERILSDLWDERVVNRYYKCSTCGHEEIVQYIVVTRGE